MLKLSWKKEIHQVKLRSLIARKHFLAHCAFKISTSSEPMVDYASFHSPSVGSVRSAERAPILHVHAYYLYDFDFIFMIFRSHEALRLAPVVVRRPSCVVRRP